MKKSTLRVIIYVSFLILFAGIVWRFFREREIEANEFFENNPGDPTWSGQIEDFRNSYPEEMVFSYSYVIPIQELHAVWGTSSIRLRIFNGMRGTNKVIILGRYNANNTFDKSKMLLMDSSPLCPLNCDYLTSTNPETFVAPNRPLVTDFNQAKVMIDEFNTSTLSDKTTELTLPEVTMQYFSNAPDVRYLKVYHSLDAGLRKLIVVGLNPNGDIIQGLRIARIIRPLCPLNCY